MVLKPFGLIYPAMISIILEEAILIFEKGPFNGQKLKSRFTYKHVETDLFAIYLKCNYNPPDIIEDKRQ
jgi:hypothetical protein